MENMAALLQNPRLLGASCGGLGVLSHLTYFIRGEHHTESFTYLVVTVFSAAIIYLGQVVYLDVESNQASRTTSVILMSFLAGLYTSLVTYRAFFHRLGKFPGPFMARISKLYHVFSVIPKSDNHLVLDRLYHKYGPFVRTGPNEVTIFAKEGPVALLGPNSPCVKAPWYDAGLPLVSMHTARDKGSHDRRRRVWDRGFGAKALRDYESRVVKYAHSLVKQIAAYAGKPVNATMWISFYGFDVMGDLAFGKSFDLLETGKKHFALKLMHDGQSYLGFLGPIPWALPILKRIPLLMDDFIKWIKWSEQKVEERRHMDVEERDVMSWLLDASKTAVDKVGDGYWLSGDSRLLIVAGSDTTSTTLTHIFYYLAKYPEQFAKLRAEIKGLVKSDTAFDVKDVREASHLNGVINEALRLYPPVPSGVYRLTPPEGLTIGDTFIPGGCTVITPGYTLGRLESCYVHPEEFIPERWYSKPELLKYKDAFAPFSMGPYGCIGKQLALMEMRTVVSLIVLNFNVSFAPGEDGTNLFKNARDMFTLAVGDLYLVFDRVEKGSSTV